MASKGITSKLKEILNQLSSRDLPQFSEKDKVPSINDIIKSFKEQLKTLPELGQEFEYILKFCLGITDQLQKVVEELHNIKKLLNSQNSQTKEETQKQNLINYLKILEKTNANKNMEILKTMIANVDKLFMKLQMTIVQEDKIKWQECNFDEMKMKYIDQSEYCGKTNQTGEFNYNQFCSISRFSNQQVLICGGQYSQGSKKVSQAHILAPGIPSREISDRMSVERYRHSMLTVDNYIQVAGGTNDRRNTLNDFWKLDTITIKWEELENMLNKRESFFMSEQRSKYIIVAGGFNGLLHLDSLELYNIKLNKWSYLNVRLPRVDNFSVGQENVGISVDISEGKDELQIFGGCYDRGEGLKISTNIYKCSMSKVYEAEIDAKADDGDVKEEDKQQDLLENTHLKVRHGIIRMFDKIGSKIIMVVVDHPTGATDSSARSEQHVLQMDFDDEKKELQKLRIEDHLKEKNGESSDHLTPAENDIQTACLTQ